MVKNDLIDRYIYAVTKHMKSAMKKDVAAELETIISYKICWRNDVRMLLQLSVISKLF